MKVSKFVLAAFSAVLMSSAAFAQDAAMPATGGPAAGGDISARKTEVLAHMDARIAALTEAKSCISAAADKEAMKKCHDGLKDDRMAMKMEHMDKKINRMEMRKNKLEAKKNAP
jgi:opacity protein-like surface antigen